MIHEILGLGVVISIVFYEITGIAPGGLIVPVYCALYLDNPRKLLVTLAVSAATVLLLKLLSRYTILYGRRRFAVCIILSFLLKAAFRYAGFHIFGGYVPFFAADSIGTIIPGILAQEIDRNGPVRTFASLIILAIFIKAMIEIMYGIG